MKALIVALAVFLPLLSAAQSVNKTDSVKKDTSLKTSGTSVKMPDSSKEGQKVVFIVDRSDTAILAITYVDNSGFVRYYEGYIIRSGKWREEEKGIGQWIKYVDKTFTPTWSELKLDKLGKKVLASQYLPWNPPPPPKPQNPAKHDA